MELYDVRLDLLGPRGSTYTFPNPPTPAHTVSTSMWDIDAESRLRLDSTSRTDGRRILSETKLKCSERH